MSTKETKKEKSFNGTKAKFSPNVVVPEKKSEVKLRRKESEKVKQPGESNRKSVFGRFFHFADSDDSRKKTAAADAKKKKSRDFTVPGEGGLDLPEYGAVVRPMPAMQGNVPDAVNYRMKSMTLMNQTRDSRNRWSSFDLNFFNNSDGQSQRQPAVPFDCPTLSRSQSEETLFQNLAAGSKQTTAAASESFDATNHSDLPQQTGAMRIHAQLLRSIQKKANGSKESRTDRTSDIQDLSSPNGWLFVTKQMTFPEGHLANDASAKEIQIADQQHFDSKNVSSSDKPSHVSGSNKTGQCVADSSSNDFALLEEKGKMINQALTNKRKILSQLFRISEKDMDGLLEKDVPLSDVSVREAVMLSVLQSDRLTSVINDIMIPFINFSKMKNGTASQGENTTSAFEEISGHTKSLQSTAFQLHGHLETLKNLMDQQSKETNQMKKDLENTQERIKLLKSQKDSTLLEQNPMRSKLLEESKTILSTLPEQNSSDTTLQEYSIPEISVNISTVDDEGSHLDSSNSIHESNLEKSEEQEDQEKESLQNLITFSDEKDFSVEGQKEADSRNNSSDNITDLKQLQPPTVPNCIVPNKELLDDNISPLLLSPVVEVVEVPILEKAIVPDKPNIYHQVLDASLPDNHDLGCFAAENVSIIKPAENEDVDSVIRGESDLLGELHTDSGMDMAALYHGDGGRRFHNLEAIPEDDDKCSVCDSESKTTIEHENLEQEGPAMDLLKVMELSSAYQEGEFSETPSEAEMSSGSNLESTETNSPLHNVKQPETDDELELLAEEPLNESLVEKVSETKEGNHGDLYVNGHLENTFVESSLTLGLNRNMKSEAGNGLETDTEPDLIDEKSEKLESEPEKASCNFDQEIAGSHGKTKSQVISCSDGFSELENMVNIEVSDKCRINQVTDGKENQESPVSEEEDDVKLDDNGSGVSEGFLNKLMTIEYQ